MNVHPGNTAPTHEEIVVDPFEAAEKEGLGLEVLATLSSTREAATTSTSCAFRLDGQPCKLCGEEDEDSEELKEGEREEEKEASTTTTNPDPYERKKQKAKQSRASLNTALQQLAHAMEVVTDDASERVERLDYMPLPLPQKYSPEKHKKCHSKSMTDRPKFIQAATSVLLGMNQQCKALEQEVVRLRAALEQQTPDDSKTASCRTSKRKTPCCSGDSQQQPTNTKKRCCGKS